MSETESEGLIRTVTPITPKKISLGNKILDAVIGIGAMLLLLPISPFLLLLWLWDRFVSDDTPNDS